MKKGYIWFIEIIVWLIIVLIGFSFYINKYELNNNNIYYILVNDAGGLEKGSPVYLLGINIGRIKDIEIIKNKVFLSLLVTKKNISIPKKAIATIEFYGLGGSTSLVLTPSNDLKAEQKDTIAFYGTYRIKDYWDNSALQSRTMIETYDSLRFSIDKADLLNNKQIFFQSDFINQYLEKTQKITKAQSVIINKLENKKYNKGK